MAILQVHQVKALKKVHEGSTEPGLMQELRAVTDFALRAMKVTARSLGKAMSTMVVQERHLWLNLAEMKDVDKPSSSQWYSSRPRRSSTSCPGVTHRPPLPPGPGLSLPIAVGDLLCPPELLHPRLNRPKSSSRSTKRPRRGQPEDVGVCSFSGDGENSAAPSPGGGPGGESYVFFCFFSETFPTFSKKEQFPFPPGSLAHDPSCQQPRECGSGTQYFPTHLWPVPLGLQGVRRGCLRTHHATFCTIQPYSTLLHHHRYDDCAFGAACTASGGVAHTAQPVLLAHAHNSTRPCDLVRQATSQVQRRSRDFGGSLERPCLARGDCCPPGKGCN